MTVREWFEANGETVILADANGGSPALYVDERDGHVCLNDANVSQPWEDADDAAQLVRVADDLLRDWESQARDGEAVTDIATARAWLAGTVSE